MEKGNSIWTNKLLKVEEHWCNIMVTITTRQHVSYQYLVSRLSYLHELLYLYFVLTFIIVVETSALYYIFSTRKQWYNFFFIIRLKGSEWWYDSVADVLSSTAYGTDTRGTHNSAKKHRNEWVTQWATDLVLPATCVNWITLYSIFRRADQELNSLVSFFQGSRIIALRVTVNFSSGKSNFGIYLIYCVKQV